MTPAPDVRKSTAREYFESIVIAVILALFIRTFVVQAFKIPSGSMEQNLLIGDHLLVNKFVYGPPAGALDRALLPVRPVRRGDVIVFKYPEEPERDFIKRIIGLPGDTLELRNKKIFINGTALSEPYTFFLQPAVERESDELSHDVRNNFGPVTVPPDHYFAMGDNRDNSQDSRYWGFLPRSYIKGRALVIYWSYAGDEEEAGEPSGVGERIGRLVSVLAHFATRTRWSRMLRVIH